MLKKYFIVVFIVGCCSHTYAQAYEKKSSVISVGYGVNNIWKALFKKSVLNGYYSSLGSAGPVTFIYEYGFHKRISAGVAISYSSIKAVSNYGSFVNTEKLTNFSSLARVTYHVLNKEKWDGYLGVGAGYFKFNYTSKDNSGSSNGGSGIKVPGAFGYSGLGGAKYYFTPHLAGMAEVGFVAGSYGQLGLAYKF
ncbi:MAG: hypothetical protein ABIT96_05140 [Ferruginibacter sp.]